MFKCNYSKSLDIIDKFKGFDVIINYNKNNYYNKILLNNNFVQVDTIANAIIYERKKL